MGRGLVTGLLTATAVVALLIGGAARIRLGSEPSSSCKPTTEVTDPPEEARRALNQASIYGSTLLWVAEPVFYPATDGTDGYVSYVSVAKAEDVELTGTLVSGPKAGEVIIQRGAALAGVQRVPVGVPAAGCWTLALAVPGAAPVVLTLRIGQ